MFYIVFIEPKCLLTSKFFYMYIRYLLVLAVFFVGCTQKKAELVWNQSYPVIGSQSSPRSADLNNDGVLDFVMGGGKNEYQESDFGVFAFDGKTGKTLWNYASKDQVYGSATFIDIDSDGTNDVVIGGRSNILVALNGKNGKLIWEWTYTYENDPILKNTLGNFQNTVVIPDQNGDKIPDLLVQNGGNPKALPNTEYGRLPGVLLVLNSKNGNVISAAITPDGGESYTPPLYFVQPNGKEYIVFGTGGETLDGSLYVTTLQDLRKGNIEQSRLLVSEKNHGYIAPPVAADINLDGFFDIVAISHGSKITAIDGKSFEKIWEKVIPNTESSNALSVGYFTNDEILDFFTFTSKGVWPDSKGSVQVMLNGKTGEIAYENNLGCTGFSSPVIYDINNDGTDDAILSINEYNCERGFVSDAKLQIKNKLISIDFANKVVGTIDETPNFKNIFSTPWIGDIDGDKYLDVVYCQYYSAGPDLLLFLGMQIKRISSGIKIKKPIVWGAYMNSQGNSVFEKTK